jgi:uncharacterized membrane protein
MSDLVVIAFPTEAAAEEVRKKSARHAAGIPDRAGDAVIAVNSRMTGSSQPAVPSDDGRRRTGAFWGTLIGLLFLMPLAGAALGAAEGRSAAPSPMSGSTTIL